MGLGRHEINAIRLVYQRFGPLGRVATLGRQCLAGAYTSRSGQVYQGFCESLLTSEFGATVVHSYDFSDYEGATHIHDLGRPLPQVSEYDLVLDSGTSEHIFNISQSLLNAARLVKPHGIVLHCLPSNSFCGHGMYQVSPELFFSLYSVRNGFATEVFLAEYFGFNCFKYWYRVEEPRNLERVEFSSKTSLGVIVVARKGAVASIEGVYQSDYSERWAAAAAGEKIAGSILRSRVKIFLISIGLFVVVKQFINFFRIFLNTVDYKKHGRIRKLSIEKLLEDSVNWRQN
jgi:hypothetical protein